MLLPAYAPLFFYENHQQLTLLKKQRPVTGSFSFPQAYLQKLGNLGDFENSVVLAVTVHFVYSLLGLVADSGNLVGLDVGFNNLGRDLGLVDNWSADFDVIAIDHQQWLKGNGLAVGLNQLNLDGLAFSHQVLLTAGGDNCFFHTFALSLEKLATNRY